MYSYVWYHSTIPSFLHAWFCVVSWQYYNASPLHVYMDYAYWCHVMYTYLMDAYAWMYMSCGSTHVKVHILWKHMQEVHAWNKTRMHLTCNNLLTKSIALYYTNILLVDQHNVTYHLFSGAYIKSWWIF